MILLNLLLIPLLGLLTMSVYNGLFVKHSPEKYIKLIKFAGLLTSMLNLLISLMIFIKFDFSYNQFQFVQKYHNINLYDFYLGIDGLSIYFILLTCIIIPLCLLSNWTSISKNIKSYVIILLLLETFLLLVFLVLDILLYYIFFESILFPLFILIGLYGSNNKIRASFYLFLYTLIGSLFLLLSIINIYTITGVTDFNCLYKTNFDYYFQFFIFYGIFLSFAVKTPTIFLNNWLLKAHVESPLAGSLILASVVLKLSLYGITRLILPILPKAYLDSSYLIYIIGVITIIYASLGTLRTIDIKELIAYSSVSHAAVYFLGVFSNNIQGIEGAIILGLAHGFVSSGLFICAGGVLYDRSGNRLITIYRGLAQIMPIFSILFFLLCLSNSGAPLTINFLGEFMCLYGAFERLPLLGIFASTSVLLSAAYSMYMLNRLVFGGSPSKFFIVNISDINKREFSIVFILISFTIFFGIYPAPILDGLHYYITGLIYNYDNSTHILFLFLPFTKKNFIKKKPSFTCIIIYSIIATIFAFLLRYVYVNYSIYTFISASIIVMVEFMHSLYIYQVFYKAICQTIYPSNYSYNDFFCWKQPMYMGINSDSEFNKPKYKHKDVNKPMNDILFRGDNMDLTNILNPTPSSSQPQRQLPPLPRPQAQPLPTPSSSQTQSLSQPLPRPLSRPYLRPLPRVNAQSLSQPLPRVQTQALPRVETQPLPRVQTQPQPRPRSHVLPLPQVQVQSQVQVQPQAQIQPQAQQEPCPKRIRLSKWTYQSNQQQVSHPIQSQHFIWQPENPGAPQASSSSKTPQASSSSNAPKAYSSLGTPQSSILESLGYVENEKLFKDPNKSAIDVAKKKGIYHKNYIIVKQPDKNLDIQEYKRKVEHNIRCALEDKAARYNYSDTFLTRRLFTAGLDHNERDFAWQYYREKLMERGTDIQKNKLQNNTSITNTKSLRELFKYDYEHDKQVEINTTDMLNKHIGKSVYDIQEMKFLYAKKTIILDYLYNSGDDIRLENLRQFHSDYNAWTKSKLDIGLDALLNKHQLTGRVNSRTHYSMRYDPDSLKKKINAHRDQMMTDFRGFLPDSLTLEGLWKIVLAREPDFKPELEDIDKYRIKDKNRIKDKTN